MTKKARTASESEGNMMMMNMPDFLNALRVARVRWPGDPKNRFPLQLHGAKTSRA